MIKLYCFVEAVEQFLFHFTGNLGDDDIGFVGGRGLFQIDNVLRVIDTMDLVGRYRFDILCAGVGDIVSSLGCLRGGSGEAIQSNGQRTRHMGIVPRNG